MRASVVLVVVVVVVALAAPARAQTFGADVTFLRAHTDVVVLGGGRAQLVVAPAWQGRVGTSTAGGRERARELRAAARSGAVVGGVPVGESPGQQRAGGLDARGGIALDLDPGDVQPVAGHDGGGAGRAGGRGQRRLLRQGAALAP